MSLHADMLLIRRDVRATIAAVLEGFDDDGELQQLARGSYQEVLGCAGNGNRVFSVKWVDGWTIVIGAALTMYGQDVVLEGLATQLDCEVLVAIAVGTSASYGFSRFNPRPTRQFAVDDDAIILDEGTILAAEREPRPKSFGESDLMLVLARHAVDLRAAWALPDWETWGALAPIQQLSPGEVLRAKRRTRLAVPAEVSIDAHGWTRCPECRRRFKVSDGSVFSNGKHKCGKHLVPVYQ